MPGMEGTMHEFKEGELHSGRGKGGKKGKKVKSRKQAIAIGLSQERKMGHKVPMPSSMRKEMAKRY